MIIRVCACWSPVVEQEEGDEQAEGQLQVRAFFVIECYLVRGS